MLSSLNPYMKLRQNGTVSLSIRLAARGQRLRSYETSRGRNSEQIERRTSNAQHRTLNIDDATPYPFYNKRTAEHWTAELWRVDSLCSVFFKLTECIIRCWTFNVRRSFLINPLYETSQGQSFLFDQTGCLQPEAVLKPKPTLPMFIVMFPGLKYQAAGDNG